MFKIAKLEKVNNEKVTINLATQEQSQYENGKKVSFEKFNTLTFDISGDDYSFGFDLNCKLEKLLEIPMNETIDFKDYIFGGETWLNVKGLNGVEPEMDIKITRYLKNRFIIFLNSSSGTPRCCPKESILSHHHRIGRNERLLG